MKFYTFARFFSKLGLGRKDRKPQRARPGRRISLEHLEERTMPAVAPSVVTLPQAVVTNPTILNAGYDPQIAMNPANPQDLVEIAASTGNGILGMYSTNGGNTWIKLPVSPAGTLAYLNDVADPTIVDNPVPTPYNSTSSPSVAWDRDGNFYVVRNEFNAAGTSGAIVLTKFTMVNNVPEPVAAPADPAVSYSSEASLGGVIDPTYSQILYQWYGEDPAFNPVVAIDTNQPTFTDPSTGVVQTDTLANDHLVNGVSVPKAIFVSWNENLTLPQIHPNRPSPLSAVLIAVSEDGANSFTTQEYVSTTAYASSYAPDGITTASYADPILTAAAPQIFFTQGQVAGGTLGDIIGSVVSTVPGNANTGVSAVQTLTLSAGVAGAEFTLAFDNQTTAPITYDSDVVTQASDIQTALNNLLVVNQGTPLTPATDNIVVQYAGLARAGRRTTLSPSPARWLSRTSPRLASPPGRSPAVS